MTIGGPRSTALDAAERDWSNLQHRLWPQARDAAAMKQQMGEMLSSAYTAPRESMTACGAS